MRGFETGKVQFEVLKEIFLNILQYAISVSNFLEIEELSNHVTLIAWKAILNFENISSWSIWQYLSSIVDLTQSSFRQLHLKLLLFLTDMRDKNLTECFHRLYFKESTILWKSRYMRRGGKIIPFLCFKLIWC